MQSNSKYPYTYRVYGLDIVSQFPITGFNPIPIENAMVFIHEGIVPDELPDTLNKGAFYQASESEFLLNVEGIAKCLARNGNEVIVQQLSKSKISEVSAFLNGTILGVLLHQRRMLPLHASTVIYENRGLLFAGMSGVGKSTLVALLINKGATLVADDISVFDFSNNRIMVLPAFPAIKLWEDSLKHLGLNGQKLIPVRDEIRKYYFQVKSFSNESTIIDHIFILSTHNKDTFQVKDIFGVDKFKTLKHHTYFFRSISDTILQQNHFFLVSKLASQLPITVINRPNAEFDIEKLVKEISCHLTIA